MKPIAIIGRACLLPGANTPETLWQNTLNRKDALTDASDNYWKVNINEVLVTEKNHPKDFTHTIRGGYVKGFDTLFKAEAFEPYAETILQQDILCQWLIHVGFAALQDAHYSLQDIQQQNAGAIIGNLSYPTHDFSTYAEAIWLTHQQKNLFDKILYDKLIARTNKPNHRFMSGYPVHLMAKVLGLKKQAYAIDAACASSLYAIKLACDQLNNGHTNLMLAGGINASDDLFLHIGFTALQALSKSGQSRPLHQNADGLIPAQGAAIVLLKRLEDAIADKNKIYGVIRGIGLANDGSKGGFLLPAQEGQIRAMKNAYQANDITPNDISWIDSHATGTPVGDRVEMESLCHFFGKNTGVHIGTLKANIGHTITASGAAALINVLSAFEHETQPPCCFNPDDSIDLLQNNHFQLLPEAIPWKSKNSPRYAAINSFGFGGNNAHLIVQDWQKKKNLNTNISHSPIDDIAIVGIGVKAAGIENVDDFKKALLNHESKINHHESRINTINLPISEIRFPPVDLKNTLGQQLILLNLLNDLIKKTPNIDPEKTSVFIGMQCDAEIARHGLKWRLSTFFPHMDKDWIEKTQETIISTLTPAHVIGYMPNIVTNRLNAQFNFQGSSFSVSAEELSGIRALEIAIQSLKNQEIDTAIVGAVDLSCEMVHTQATKALLSENKHIPGDAAVLLILKRAKDAKQLGNKVYGIFPQKAKSIDAEIHSEKSLITSLFGHSHATSGLLHVAATAAVSQTGFIFSNETAQPIPCPIEKPVTKINCRAMGDQIAEIIFQSSFTEVSIVSHKVFSPKIHVYSGNSHEELLQNLLDPAHKTRVQEHMIDKPMKLAIVTEQPEELLKKRERATYWLKQNNQWHFAEQEGIYFQSKPIKGDLAFVFTCSMTSYPRMGLDLFPEFIPLAKTLKLSDSELENYIRQISEIENGKTLPILQELKIYSFLTQFHGVLSQKYLNLLPKASIGYCAGETNALFALGAWSNMPDLHENFIKSKIYDEMLHGKYTILNQKPWQSFELLINFEEAQVALKNKKHVHLTMINSPKSCVISGEPKECEAVIKALNCIASPLAYSLVLHCPEFLPAAKLWHQLHLRETHSIPNIQFYSTGTGKPYSVNKENVANALLSQASSTVNFPQVINQAYENGVKIFVEHGPRNLCTRWIHDTLGKKEHIAISLDVKNRNPVLQLAHTTAALLVAGVDTNSHFVYEGNL